MTAALNAVGGKWSLICLYWLEKPYARSLGPFGRGAGNILIGNCKQLGLLLLSNPTRARNQERKHRGYGRPKKLIASSRMRPARPELRASVPPQAREYFELLYRASAPDLKRIAQRKGLLVSTQNF
jgi:hypothetical protein